MVLGISPSLYFFMWETEWRLKDMKTHMVLDDLVAYWKALCGLNSLKHPTMKDTEDINLVDCGNCLRLMEAPAQADAEGVE